MQREYNRVSTHLLDYDTTMNEYCVDVLKWDGTRESKNAKIIKNNLYIITKFH